MQKTDRLQKVCIIFIFLFIVIIYFLGIGSYPLLDINEANYAEIAREMLVNKNYIIPKLNYLPYLEKPPLLYWAISASYTLFGISEFAVRFIPSLSATILCIALILFGMAVNYFKEACIAAIILASSPIHMLIGRTVFPDSLLATTMTVSLLLFYVWWQRRSNGYLFFAYIILAFACLSKGFLPLLLCGGIIISYAYLLGELKHTYREILHPIGLLLFAAILLPWHIAVGLELPSFIWDFFINEQCYRFLDKRIPHDYHTGSIFYYIPRVFIYLFPWSLLIPALFKRTQRKLPTKEPLTIFLWLWFTVALLLFSLSKAKGDYYMVVAMPAIAMLLGIKITHYLQQRKKYLLNGLFLLATLCYIFLTVYFLMNSRFPAQFDFYLQSLLVFLLVYYVMGICLLIYNKNIYIPIILSACLSFPLLISCVHYKTILLQNYTQLSLAQFIKEHDPDRTVYFYRNFEELSSLVFYLQKRVMLIDSLSGDLYFGAKTNYANGWLISTKEFTDKEQERPNYVVLLQKQLSDFLKAVKPKPYYLCAMNGTALLLSNTQTGCLPQYC